MAVFDLVTTNNYKETISDIMQRVIGATASQVDDDIAQVASGQPTPYLLINGVSNGGTIPDVMLSVYKQFYAQAVSLPQKTGFKYWQSLDNGGFLPYDGQGAS